MDLRLIDCARHYLYMRLMRVNTRLESRDGVVQPYDEEIRTEISSCLRELEEIENPSWFGGCTPTRSSADHPSDELECYLQIVREVYGFTIPEQGG